MTVCGKQLKLSPPGTGTFHNFMARLLLHDITQSNGFGGLGVACWPLVPKFAGSNSVRADGGRPG